MSAGYDAAIGCPEGEMEVTPACYGHLTHMLKSLAGGKLVVVLEVCTILSTVGEYPANLATCYCIIPRPQGGYCIKSLAESAMHTLRALLDEPLPSLPPLRKPDPEYFPFNSQNTLYIS